MRALYLASVWLHLLGAVTWVGGMLFLVLVMVPVLRGRPFGAIQIPLLDRIGLRLRYVGWAAMGLLLVSGVANVTLRGGWAAWPDGALWAGRWGHALAAKLVLVGVTLAVSAAHDFWVGPRAMRLLETAPRTPACRRYRRAARWMGRAMLLLSLGVLALAATLPRGGL